MICSRPTILRTFPAYLIAAGVLTLLAASDAVAQGRKKNPASKIYVSDMQGEADIQTDDKIVELTKKSVHSAEGTVIETKKAKDPNDKDKTISSMVFSNGTGIAFDPDTRLEVKKFMQEPFTPNRSDMETEPSISQTQNFLVHGLVSLCTSKQVAGSSMTYSTPHGSVNIRGRKLVIEANDEYTRIAMIEGESTVRGGTGSATDSGGQTLHSGEEAYIRHDASGRSLPMQIQRIPPSELGQLDDKVSMACMAKKTVYFEVAERRVSGEETATGPVTAFDSNGGTEQEIVPVEVVPAELPVQYNISPAKLGSG